VSDGAAGDLPDESESSEHPADKTIASSDNRVHLIDMTFAWVGSRGERLFVIVA
jgi:hypothetical protein